MRRKHATCWSDIGHSVNSRWIQTSSATQLMFESIDVSVQIDRNRLSGKVAFVF